MAHNACAAVQQATGNRVLVAAMDEASFQVGPVVGKKEVYATTHGLTFDNLRANARSLQVNLMTFVRRECSMASFTYLNNTNKAVLEENLALSWGDCVSLAILLTCCCFSTTLGTTAMKFSSV